jgi:hypothetical protein
LDRFPALEAAGAEHHRAVFDVETGFRHFRFLAEVVVVAGDLIEDQLAVDQRLHRHVFFCNRWRARDHDAAQPRCSRPSPQLTNRNQRSLARRRLVLLLLA